ncbi:MAG: hypothetical protein IJU23_05595 [Proteobacteria bacterium]|nr:hypothetical protein [Pseudomonadota bacterium]
MKGCLKYFLSILFILTCCKLAYADDCSDLRATMPAVESNIKAIEPQLLTCLQDEKGDSVIIRISYKADGSIKVVNIDDVKKKTRTCIREAFANVTFDIDVTSIINKRKSARGIPTKPTPRYQEDENGNLVYVGSTRGTVSYFMPEGRVVYAYNSENKSLTAKHHYMIGRTRAETEKNLCY